MIKKRIGRIAVSVLSAPVLLLAFSTSAHAGVIVGNGTTVTWENAQFRGYCLAGMSSWGTPYEVALEPCKTSDVNYGTDWLDVSNGDGTWYEVPKGHPGYCLTGYTDHDAYIEPCKANSWERWREQRQPDGRWKLQNVQTGEYLDYNGHEVYTEPYNDGNYQAWL